MVEDGITDGRRIAELLASELTGLAEGPLAEVSVVDADPDVEPSPEGAVAYAIAYEGDRVGEVRVRPSAAVVELETQWPKWVETGSRGLSTDEDGSVALVVERGAAVKRVTDAIRDALAA